MDEFDYRGYVAACHLKKGDIIDIVSDMLNFGLYAREHKQKFSPDGLIDAFMDAVGSEGTIMIRAFNWGFCHGIPFDIKKTPSKVGALGNYALKRKEFKRTRHPIYSWMVWGKYQDELCSLDDPDAFGKGSVFEWIVTKEGLMVHIGEPKVSGRTIFHLCEQRNEMPYRFTKFWKNEYVDNDGNCSQQIYSMFVRDIDDPLGFEESNLEDYIMYGTTKYYYYDSLPIYVDDIRKLVAFYNLDMEKDFSQSIFLKKYAKFPRNLRLDVYSLLHSKYPNIDFKSNHQLVDTNVFNQADVKIITSCLEKEFAVSIPKDKMNREYFNSYEGMTTLVGILLSKSLSRKI